MDEEEEMDDETQNSQVAHAKSVAKSFGKPCSKSKGASSSSTDADDVVKFLKELDMDNYDEEDGGTYISSFFSFSYGFSLPYFAYMLMYSFLHDPCVGLRD